MLAEFLPYRIAVLSERISRRLSLIYGAEAARRGGEGLATATPLLMMAGITLGTIAILPFAAAAAIRVNLR